MNKLWLVVPAAALAVWALSQGSRPEVRCGSDQRLGSDGVCTTIVEPKIVDPWKEYSQAADAVVTVSEDQVARMNAEQDAAFEASRARRQARQDMQDAAAEALRDERRRNDDY
jgi:hypothetical protein